MTSVRHFSRGIALLVLLLLLGAFFIYLPPILLRVNQLSAVALSPPADQVKAVSDLRTALLQGLAAIGAAATVLYSARTLQLNRRGQVTDRFSKAIEQIGSPDLRVRIGGIYLLENVARDSRELHGPIVENLTAFLREEARAAAVAGSDLSLPARADCRAVANVLGRRSFKHDVPGQHPDLRGVTMASCNFANAHLEGADFTNAHLEGADFTNAHLEGADFTDAHLEGAQFGRAHLRGKGDRDAPFGGVFTNAHLERAYFAAADLRWAYFRGAYLLEANFVNAHVNGAYFSGAHVQGAMFTGADGLTLAQMQEADGHKEAICNYHWTPGQKDVQTNWF